MPGLPRTLPRVAHEPVEAVARGVEAQHGEAQVRAVEARDDLARVRRDPQPLEDVAPHDRVGGRGQRERARRAELAARGVQGEVVGPEVMAPLGDAVRLVHHEEPHAVVLQPGHEVPVREPFGRDIEQRRAALDEVEVAPVLLAARDRRVDEAGRDARALQRLDLVLHERDQRRDDERAPDLEGREHVAEALAAAGRHDAEHVRLRELLEHLGLTGPERRVAEALAQLLLVAPEAVRELERGRSSGER